MLSMAKAVSINDIPLENFERRALYTSAPVDTGIITDPSSKITYYKWVLTVSTLVLDFSVATMVRRTVSEKQQYNATEYHTPFKKGLRLAFKPVRSLP